MPNPHGIAGKVRSPIPAGAGIGLRFQHHRAMLDARPAVGWLEAHSENYMGGGRPLEYLTALRRDYPISLHGVGLSLGTTEDLDEGHLDRTRRLIERIEPGLVSEHLSWSIAGGTYLADLLPLPMTEEALAVVCRHVDEVQTLSPAPDPDRKPLVLSPLPAFDDRRMGLSCCGRRSHRLRASL